MIKYISNLLDFNQATLSGCIDIIVIEHEDGSLVSSPFHVRFGKLKLLKSAQKEIRISVNGVETELRMRMGKSGEGKRNCLKHELIQSYFETRFKYLLAYFLQPIGDSMSTSDQVEEYDDKKEEIKDSKSQKNSAMIDNLGIYIFVSCPF